MAEAAGRGSRLLRGGNFLLSVPGQTAASTIPSGGSKCWPAARCPWVEEERSVKPSAQPTLVRTQHLPPPAETAPWLRKRTPRGRFPSCHAAYHSVSRCVDMSRCPRTYSGRRPCRSRGRGHRRLSTDGHGRARQRGRVLAQGSGSARCAARRQASPQRGGRRVGGRASGAADRAICCPGRERAARALARGVHPGRLSRNVIYPADPAVPNPRRTPSLREWACLFVFEIAGRSVRLLLVGLTATGMWAGYGRWTRVDGRRPTRGGTLTPAHSLGRLEVTVSARRRCGHEPAGFGDVPAAVRSPGLR
jgi:hypothetical protein